MSAAAIAAALGDARREAAPGAAAARCMAATVSFSATAIGAAYWSLGRRLFPHSGAARRLGRRHQDTRHE